MNIEYYVSIGSFLVAIVSMITSFVLQRDSRKLRDLERENSRYKDNLRKAMNAIKGYQQIEEEQARQNNQEVSNYRAKIRKELELQEYFDTNFLSPSRVKELLNEINK
jgi:hypothetical protein